MKKVVLMSIYAQTGMVHPQLRRHESAPKTDIDHTLNAKPNGKTNQINLFTQASSEEDDTERGQSDLTRPFNRA